MKKHRFYKNLTASMLALSFAICLVNPIHDVKAESGYKESDYPASFAKYTAGKKAWDVSAPSPLEGTISSTITTTTVVNDGSTELPAESYLPLDDIEGGTVYVIFGFNFDRQIEGTSFKFVGKKKTIFNIYTKGLGLYLEQPDGNDIYLCSYKPGTSADRDWYAANVLVDLDNQIIKRVQINSKTYVENVPFMTETNLADGLDISTTEEAIGLVSCTGVYIDRGYFVNETFITGSDKMPDDWNIYETGGNAVITEPNSNVSYRQYLTIDTRSGGISISKDIEKISGKISFEINLLQPEKRDGFAIALEGDGNRVIEFSSNGNSFCYTDENGNKVPFYEYVKNVWYNLEVHIDTDSGTYDIDLNNRPLLKGIKLPYANAVNKVTINSSKNNTQLCVDNILLYRTRPYADDYPVLNEIPQKKDGAPLVGIQMCPMWTEGNHFGWDWIKQASNRRKPVTGFYDQPSAEQADWNIKHMLEHGVDYMSICMFPHDGDLNGSEITSQITDKDYRSTSYVSAVQNARYSDKIKYSIFLEANGITQGHAYYDDFFEIVWPHYIEHYFKDPRYLKIDGRPVFGCYAISNLYNVFNDGRGAEAIKEGVERMRQMCIDAGVGNPYLIVNNGFYQVGLAAAGGFDAVSSYGLGYDATFTYQKQVFTDALAQCKKYNVDFIVSPVPMRDDTAWRINAGYWHTEEEFDAFLKWMKDDLLKDYKPGVSQKLCNMCTWDEFGEGHIICPTEGLGFRYLDAMRSALTNGGEHTDEFLTDSQKKRITHLYRDDRKFGDVIYESTVDYKVFYEAREKDIPSKIPDDVKLGWYFTKAADAAKITGISGVDSIKSTSEGVEVYPSDRNPRVRFTEIDSVDVYDVTFVKIRMKKNPTSGGGFFYWSGDIVPGINNDKKIFFNAGIDGGNEFRDYYVPVASCVSWTGKVDNIEIMLGDVSDYTKPFVIESIEFLQDKDITAKDKLIVDGRVQSLTDPAVEKNGVLMLPLKEIAYMTGVEKISLGVLRDEYTVKYNKRLTTVRAGNKAAEIDGRRVMLPIEPYTKSDIINDTLYVPVSFFEELFYDKTVIWNGEERTLYITSLEIPEEEVNKEVIYRVDYDDESDLANPNGLTAISVKGGKMTATTSNNDPNFALALNKPAESIKFIQIKINTNSPQNLKYYFITNKSTRWEEAKGSGMVQTVGGNNTIMFDTSLVSTWTDTITTFRIDPSTTSGQTFSLDSVVFYGEELAAGAKTGSASQKDMSSSITQGKDKLEWTFDKNTYLDGWETSKSLANISLKKGILNATVAGNAAALVNRKDIDIEASKIKNISIRYENVTNSESMRIYFLTSENRAITEECSFVVPISQMHEGMVEHIIDVKENENWKGTLKRLIIAPEKCTKGRLAIDSISILLESGDTE